ncbi:nucleoside triphosphate hydrolase [Consotaella aegiceratis]|uniref:nucleoside triphosphate hydrolase n=1 Tax=Consotaella aegiceratis TaxID=3097961 RepID=UPI002F4004D4
MTALDRHELVDELDRRAGTAQRLLVAIAGPPGSGKSTLAEWLRDRLNERRAQLAEILAMDGFHYDDRVLEAAGERARKGAPHTFDVDGLAATLERLHRNDGRDVAVPVFDREIEIARAGARIIRAGVRIVVVEGNYLLLDDPAWAPLRRFFAMTVMLDVPEPVLEARLTQRWLGFGYGPDALRDKMEGNDMPNVRLVQGHSVPADYTVGER